MTISSLPSTSLAAADTHGDSAARADRLRNAARQFEASLIAELTKPLQEKSAIFSDSSDSSEGSAGALSSYASEAFARALADHGGFGIARSILSEINPGAKA